MQLSVNVRGMDGIKSALSALSQDLRDKAAVMALNKVGPKARTEMTRAITEQYNIKRADVTASLSLKGARVDSLQVVLNPFAGGRRGRAMNLIHFFDHKTTLREAKRAKKAGKRSGVVVNGREYPLLYFKIKRNEAAKPVPGAFIGNHGRTVFMREGNGRLPIKAVSTVGVPQMFSTKQISQRVLNRINAELPVEFERAARVLLERFNRK